MNENRSFVHVYLVCFRMIDLPEFILRGLDVVLELSLLKYVNGTNHL